MTPAQEPLLIDPRAGSGDLAPMVRELGVPVRVQEMPFGDAQVVVRGPEGRPVLTGVEVKKVPDLLDSVKTERLTGHQLPGMLDSFEVNYLLIEGQWTMGQRGELLFAKGVRWKEPRPGGYPYQAWVERLMTWELKHGIRLAYTGNRLGTAGWLAALWRWGQGKAWEAHSSDKTMRLVDLDTMGAGKDPLQGFYHRPTKKMKVAAVVGDGIGYEKAKSIAEKFGSVRQMVNAEVPQVMGPGVGKVLATRLVAEFRRGE